MAKRRPSGDGMVRKEKMAAGRAGSWWATRKTVTPSSDMSTPDTQKELTAKLRQHIDIYQGCRPDRAEQDDLGGVAGSMAGEHRRHHSAHYAGPLSGSSTHSHQSPLRRQPHYPGTGKDVQKLYDALASHGNQITGKGLASSTIRGIHSMLHEALDAAKQAGLSPVEPDRGNSNAQIHL